MPVHRVHRGTRRPGGATCPRVGADARLHRRDVSRAGGVRCKVAALAGAMLIAAVMACEPAARTSPGGQAAAGPARVAPVSRHGEGWGYPWYRRLVMGREPKRLDEKDALPVIQDELRRHGLVAELTPHRLDEVIVDGFEVIRETEWISQASTIRWRPIAEPLVVDLWIPELRIGMVYVSGPDFDRFGGDERREWKRDLIPVAERLCEAVREQGRGVIFGAFYDPTMSRVEVMRAQDFQADFYAPAADDAEDAQARLDRWTKYMEERMAARIEEQLRAQVRDFVNWLKTQGVI